MIEIYDILVCCKKKECKSSNCMNLEKMLKVWSWFMHLKLLQVLSFTCPCCFFVSRHVLCTGSFIVFSCLFNCNSPLCQWCVGSNLQRTCVWDNHPLETHSWWTKSNSLCSCSSIVPPPLVFHFSLLHGCGISYRSACHVSCLSEEEIPVQCVGKAFGSSFSHMSLVHYKIAKMIIILYGRYLNFMISLFDLCYCALLWHGYFLCTYILNLKLRNPIQKENIKPVNGDASFKFLSCSNNRLVTFSIDSIEGHPYGGGSFKFFSW